MQWWPRLGSGCNAPLIRFLISALYILFAGLYRTLPHLSFFSSPFPYLSPPLFIFSRRIDSLRFKAGCCKRQLNLALVFCVVVHFFWLVNACFCCVAFSFYRTRPTDWLGEMCPKWLILCRVWRRATTRSINQLPSISLLSDVCMRVCGPGR